MPPEPPKPPEKSELIIRSGSGLALLPVGDSSALSEILSRSLVHIQTSKTLEILQHRVKHELSVSRVAGDEQEFKIAPGVNITMCWIPPGEFLMGSPEDEKGRYDNETQHRVIITHGFWLAKTPTTQAQWQAVMGNNPSHFTGTDLPVEQVSWNDICGHESGNGGFLGKLNKLIHTIWHFHLPTEAQWEYACRAGTTGSCAGDLGEVGWYKDNSDGKTHPVGQKKPNAWRLHDMHGNVSEWCSDWQAEYDLTPVTNPCGGASGSFRVLRGGGWFSNARYSRVAFRSSCAPGFGSVRYFGFRIACSLRPFDHREENQAEFISRRTDGSEKLGI